MKKIFAFSLGMSVFTVFSAPAGAQVQVAAAVNMDGFHLAIGNYFHVPQQQVVVCQQNRIPDEEMPVVFFIAQRARVAPQAVIDLRAHGMGWMDIAARFRLDPQVFYVPVKGTVSGPPYGNAYGYYRHHGHGKYRFTDAEIVNFVNLRFASDYYHRPPEEIIRLRSGGQGFRDIHQKYYRGRQGQDDQGQGRWEGKDKRDRNDEGDDRGQGRFKDQDKRHGDDEGEGDGHDRGRGHSERDSD